MRQLVFTGLLLIHALFHLLNHQKSQNIMNMIILVTYQILFYSYCYYYHYYHMIIIYHKQRTLTLSCSFCNSMDNKKGNMVDNSSTNILYSMDNSSSKPPWSLSFYSNSSILIVITTGAVISREQ